MPMVNAYKTSTWNCNITIKLCLMFAEDLKIIISNRHEKFCAILITYESSTAMLYRTKTLTVSS